MSKTSWPVPDPQRLALLALIMLQCGAEGMFATKPRTIAGNCPLQCHEVPAEQAQSVICHKARLPPCPPLILPVQRLLGPVAAQ